MSDWNIVGDVVVNIGNCKHFFVKSRTMTVNILFIMPLNEPFEVIVNADLFPELNKLNTQTRIKKVDCVYPSGLLSIASYLKKHLPDASISIVDCNVEINKMAELKGGHGFTREEYFEHCLNAAEKKCPEKPHNFRRKSSGSSKTSLFER